MRQCQEGESAFESAWAELKEKGYLLQTKSKDEKSGSFAYQYDLLDTPHPQKPPHGKSRSGKSPSYNNTDSNNTIPTNTEKIYLHQQADGAVFFDDKMDIFVREFENHFGFEHRKITKSIEWGYNDSFSDMDNDDFIELIHEHFENHTVDKCNIEYFAKLLNRNI